MPINAVAVVLFVYVMGEAISSIGGSHIPGSIIGIIVLFSGFLILRRIPREASGLGDPLLSILPLLFIPSGVKVFEYADIIRDQGMPIALSITAGTIVGLAATVAAGRLLIDEKAFATSEFVSLPEEASEPIVGTLLLVPSVAGFKQHDIPFSRLAGAGVTLGRAADCVVVVENNTVSKHHARLSLDAPSGKILVEDLQSANGTWQGGRRLKSELLSDGETVRFAAVEYRLQILKGSMSVPPTEPKAAAALAATASSGPATIIMPAFRAWELAGEDAAGQPFRIRLVPRLDAKGIPCQTSWRLGRKEGADFLVSGAGVSAVHAEIQYHPLRGLEVRDMGSTNGTKVDHQRIGEHYTPLAAGQVLMLGDVALAVSRERESS